MAKVARTILAVALFVCTLAAKPETTGDESLNGHLLPGNYPNYVGRWPAASALFQNSRLRSSTNSFGTLAESYDSLTNERTPPFEYPAGSGIEYLRHGGLWVGGIIGEDTLVSTAIAIDRLVDEGQVQITEIREFYPPNALTDSRSVDPIGYEDGTGYRAVYVDTFTSSLPGLQPDFSGKPHRPLNLNVVQKSYLASDAPSSNILLLDYTITNVGPRTINQTWVGLYLDGLANATGAGHGIFEDDLAGSFRELSTAYIIDNDGDPFLGYFWPRISPVDGLGVRPVLVSPAARDTNFNWWYSSGSDDFGPRLKGTVADPYRDFGTGSTGTPSGDVNRYYMLSHAEWDYDQATTALVEANDSAWRYPDQNSAGQVARGGTVELLLSVGPVDLLPGNSMRVVFALFGTDFIHVDPSNGLNLQAGRYSTFYDNLHFGLLRDNARRAAELAWSVLNPLEPLYGLRSGPVEGNKVQLSWDPRVINDLSGYRAYLQPVHDSLIVAPNIVWPGSRPDEYRESVRTLPAGTKTAELSGLKPGQLYFASLSQLSQSGEGALSAPLVIGDSNPTLLLSKPRIESDYVFLLDNDSTVTIAWEPSPDNSVRYYRIHRAPDSQRAYQRHRPFITDDTVGLLIRPQVCAQKLQSTFCYYPSGWYDLVPAESNSYIDRSPLDGAYYWVSAMTLPGFESDFSEMVKTERIVPQSQEILVVTGSTYDDADAHNWVYLDSVKAFYDRILEGYDYDIYSWADSNLSSESCNSGYCTDWLDLARYKLIIVEEFPSPIILSKDIEPRHKMLTKLIAAGRNIAYFGTPPGNNALSLDSVGSLDEIEYDSASFESLYLGLRSSSQRTWWLNYSTSQFFGADDSLAGFSAALPMTDSLPRLTVSTGSNQMKTFINRLFNIDSYLPLTAAFEPTPEAEVLYRYESIFPTSSELRGLPCGLHSRHGRSRVFAFSFHLWGMRETDARELVDYMLYRIDRPDPPDPTPAIPKTFALHQNYPNPFNGGTVIEFDLLERTDVTLDVFNILGQRVRTLVNQTLDPNFYEWEWNGTDSDGKSVASGVYLYRLRTGNRSATMKMVLLK